MVKELKKLSLDTREYDVARPNAAPYTKTRTSFNIPKVDQLWPLSKDKEFTDHLDTHLPENEKTRKTYLAWWDKFAVIQFATRMEFSTHSVLHFFDERKKKYQPATLWQAYGSINAILMAGFEKSFKAMPNVSKRLKRWKQQAPQQKKAKAFTQADMMEYIKDDRTQPKAYLNKAVMIQGIYGGLRGDDLKKLQIRHVTTDDDGDTLMVCDFKSKTEGAAKHSYIIPDDHTGAAKIFKEYLRLL
jgi:integrase